jgi:hypothetical protein
LAERSARTFVFWPWVSLIIGAVAVLVFALCYRHETIAVPLLFAAGIFVGMVATFILFFVGIEIYCSHGHMAECT